MINLNIQGAKSGWVSCLINYMWIIKNYLVITPKYGNGSGSVSSYDSGTRMLKKEVQSRAQWKAVKRLLVMQGEYYTCIWDASFLMTRVDFEIMLGLCGAYWNMISNNRIINYVSCFVDLRMFCIWRYANNTSTHSQLIGYGHVTKITVRPCQGWKSSGRFDCAEKALQGQCRSVSWSTFRGQNIWPIYNDQTAEVTPNGSLVREASPKMALN